ncbi:MAG TPA: hypothetical protein VG325_09950 [Solirubrobacteraceae bacterium]|nr:hypothetical protein [Solirubrobacteraceae bacterium]
MTCVAVFASTGAAFASTGAAFASAGGASESCQAQPVTTPFANWGDQSSYFLAPGGSFEGTAAQVGWSLSGAGLTAGNEPFHAGGSSGRQSLTISGGGSATAPFFCLDSTMPDLRFFARQAAPGSDLEVQAVVQIGHHQFVLPLGSVADGSMPAWGPVPQIVLQGHVLPRWLRLPVALRLVVPGGQGSWQLDDVYVDPFRLG